MKANHWTRTVVIGSEEYYERLGPPVSLNKDSKSEEQEENQEDR